MTNKETYYFTGACLGLDARPESREAIVHKIVKKQVDWEGCLQLWCEHLVTTAVYLRFRSHDLLTLLPPDLVQTLEEIWELNCQRNAALLQQVDRLTALLHGKQVTPVFLKGTAHLLDGLYSDPGERMIQDIDFLVREEDYLKTAALLQASGYRHDAPGQVDFKNLKHYQPLYKPGEPGEVEIHRVPVPAAYGRQFTSHEVFRDRQPVKGRPGVYTPSDRHQLIHTFIHNQLSDKGYAYKQSFFRSFNDLLQLSNRLPVFTLPTYTNYHRKAICWLVWGQRAMGLPGRFYPFETRAAQWYSFKYNLALTHDKIFGGYLFIRKLGYLLLIRLGGPLVKATIGKDPWTSLFRRLHDPAWYGAHLRSYRGYF